MKPEIVALPIGYWDAFAEGYALGNKIGYHAWAENNRLNQRMIEKYRDLYWELRDRVDTVT